ncbi:rod shape-determining protein MreC [Calothrix sp. NIES-4071]|nr:rod shape-determining protein MreC [Calothrix sp. NIES-4071]BAZ60536.1 rod shape-determining protein MreC [Calothrix sp. NIES-4105]
MFTARWWERRGLQIGLLGLAVGTAFVLRQTQGSVLLEVYQGMTRPLEMIGSGPSKQERIRDARILELETQLADLQSQNQKLKQVLNYKEQDKTAKPLTLARVIGRSADNWWQQVTLNRGSSSGVQEGSVVRAEGGLIGLVESVTPNSSRVLLVSDLKSQVGVTVTQTGAKGVLRGDGSAEAILEFYEKVPNVKPGDLIATSTYSQKFPAGVAVGRIKSLDLKRLPASIAKIELFPPIRSLDWVEIYDKPPVQSEAPASASKPEETQKSEKSQAAKPN